MIDRTNRSFRSRTLIRAAQTAFILSLGTAAPQAVTVTAFGPSQWKTSDNTLSVNGYVIEDFEDTALAPGLQVHVTSSLASYGPTSTLPFTFSGSDDLVSGAGGYFGTPVTWDGTHTLVNRPFKPITSYANDGGWSDVSFLFENGVTSLGFSYGQAEFNVVITLDLGSGQNVSFSSASYLGGASYANGYLRFDAAPNETIYGIKLDNQAGNADGIAYDHLAFKPAAAVPDSASTLLLFGAGLISLAAFTRNPKPA